MAKRRQTMWGDLRQLSDEFSVIYARVQGQTHAQAARAESPHWRAKMQKAALTRWGCKNIYEYAAQQPQILNTAMAELKQLGTQTNRHTASGQQLAFVHEMLRLMHTCLAENDEHMRDATKIIDQEHNEDDEDEDEDGQSWDDERDSAAAHPNISGSLTTA